MDLGGYIVIYAIDRSESNKIIAGLEYNNGNIYNIVLRRLQVNQEILKSNYIMNRAVENLFQ